MRNDVKYIKKNISGNNAVSLSLLVDVFLVLLAFSLDRVFGDETEKVDALWVCVAIFGSVIPVALFVFERVKNEKKEKISRRISNTKDLVEMFDDEICYMIMSAEAFSKNLKNMKKIDSRQSALLIEFYVIETEYYLNKALTLLLKMDNNLTCVINEMNLTRNYISKTRLKNAINLMASIYKDLFIFEENQSEGLKKYGVNVELVSTRTHYNSLKDFSRRRQNIIGLDLETTFEFDTEDINNGDVKLQQICKKFDDKFNLCPLTRIRTKK